MARGKQQHDRSLVLSLAAAVWGLENVNALEFIRCGSLGSHSSVMPYDPKALEQLAKSRTWKYG